MARRQQRTCHDCGSSDYVSNVSAGGHSVRCAHCGSRNLRVRASTVQAVASVLSHKAHGYAAFIIVLFVFVLLLLVTQVAALL